MNVPWAQFVCTTDTETPPIPVSKNKFVIGRSKACDLSLPENKMVSAMHCFIQKDVDGNVWLQDTSTNGTLVNGEQKLSSSQKMKLNHGDEVHLVYRKNKEDLNVAYLFQDLAELAREELDSTQEYSSDLDQTEVASSPVTTQDSATLPEDEEVLPSKKRKINDEMSEVLPHKSAKVVDKPVATTEESSENEKTSNKCHTAKDVTGTEKKVLNKGLNTDMEETLICIICQEIMHDSVSLQPCMHTFCSGCYSDWMEQSKECPSCRLNVDRINKNHLVNNMIEAYLKANPEKKRSDEDLKELDAKNKITRDMLYPTTKRRSSSNSSAASESTYSDSGDENTLEIHRPIPGFFGAGLNFIGGTPVFTTYGTGATYLGGIPVRPPQTVCRQCVAYVEPVPLPTVTVAGSAATKEGQPSGSGIVPGESGPQPSTSDNQGGEVIKADVKQMPAPPTYVCPASQTHVLCLCCMQAMPDRRRESQTNPQVPPQQCSVCQKAYCHAYWGCRKAECLGCLAKFKDMNFGVNCLGGIILENFFESNLFQAYLKSKRMTVRDLLKCCLEKLDSGEFKCQDQARFHITSNTVICYTCGLRNFRDLCYLYRQNIPNDQIPDFVPRTDCYWGNKCRTQKNKPHHARNYNHICEQIRTS